MARKPEYMTMEQLGEAARKTIQQWSPEEKAAFRARLDKRLGMPPEGTTAEKLALRDRIRLDFLNAEARKAFQNLEVTTQLN